MASGAGESRLKQIGEAVGLLAAVAATVYLLGALVLALRLQTHNLPTLAVLSNLPRELVISFGLTYAVAPWLVAAAVVAIFWFLRDKKPAAPTSTRLLTRQELLRALGIVAVTEVFVWLVLRQLGGSFSWWDGVALAVVMIAITLLANAVWRLLSRRHALRWTKSTAIALAAVLTGLVAVPPFVEIAARAPLDEAQLCGEGPTHLNGWLVGEAGDRVYIGENIAPHRIVSQPRTAELYVGPDATKEILCRRELLNEPTADQLTTAAFAANACPGCSKQVSNIRVSSAESWFAAALVVANRQHRRAFRKLLLFRRTDLGWHVVSDVADPRISCNALEAQTGVSHVALSELSVCLLPPT